MVASRYAQIAPRQLVRRTPALAGVFERFGINYDDVGSGGGSTPLEQQIRDKRLSGEEVYHALELADCELDNRESGETHQHDWRWATLAELIELRHLLSALANQLRRHFYNENSILFPRAAVLAADVDMEAAR